MERKLKVKGTSGYRYKKTPTIQVKGLYLSQFGFSADTPLIVDITQDKIVITPATENVDIQEA